MKTTLTFLFATLFALTSFAQSFEGKIVYRNSYKSKMPNVTDDQFATLMGSAQDYFIKKGNYKSVSNGSYFQWQVYVNAENKLYNKLSNADVLTWNDASVNRDEVIKSELNKSVTKVLGYTCDELILTCKGGIKKYYFNAALSVDTALFANHKFGNWYDFLSRANALPLKSIIDSPQYFMESVAIEVKPMKLENSFFEIPVDSKTMKSPY